jgi:hypothetical protein
VGRFDRRHRRGGSGGDGGLPGLFSAARWRSIQAQTGAAHGPSLSNKKITVHILDDINSSIQKCMFMLLATNLLVALLTWIAFRWIGLENAGAWAVAAGLLHLVPYLGPGVTAAATGMAAFVQLESFSTALLVAGASVAIATVVGTFVATWMIGRIAGIGIWFQPHGTVEASRT